MNKLLSTLTALLMLVVGANAQTVEELLKPVTGTYAIKNVTIIQKPGQEIKNGTIVIKNGIIHAVGANVKVPADAEVIKADSMYVYAGFIDGLSNVGVPAPERSNNRSARPRGAIRGNPPNSLAGITPEIPASEKISIEDSEIKALRKLGFTAVHVAPRGGMLPGKSAVITLAGDKATDMILKEDVALVATFQGAPGVFPNTIMAVMTKYRELFGQARQLLAHQKAYAANPAMVRPESNETLEALIPAIEGKQPVFMLAPNVKDLYRALTLEEDLDVNIMMAGLKQGWYVADELKASKKPVLLSMDLPKEIKEEKADDKKEEKDAETKALMARKMKAYKEHVGQAATMTKANIPFAFSTMGTKPSEVTDNLKRMMKAGLTADQALTALTTAPAEMLGLDKVLGTVEKGKIANLVIADKPYFEEKSNVRFVVADGTVFPFDAPKKKAAGKKGGEKVAVAGEWSYTIDIPGQTTEGTLTLEDNDGEITGKTQTDSTPEAKIEGAELDGDVLTFSLPVDVQGQSIVLEFEITIKGNSFDGNVDVGSFGSFPIEGSKKPK